VEGFDANLDSLGLGLAGDGVGNGFEVAFECCLNTALNGDSSGCRRQRETETSDHASSSLPAQILTLHRHPANNLIRPAFLEICVLVTQQHPRRDPVPLSHDARPHRDLRLVHETGETRAGADGSEFFGFGADEEAGLFAGKLRGGIRSGSAISRHSENV